MKLRVILCRTCKSEFTIPSKRGRPPVVCPACRENDISDRDARSLDPGTSVGVAVNQDTTAARAPRPVGVGKTIGTAGKISRRAQKTKLSANDRIDQLEILLKSRGTHLQQQEK